MFAHRGRDQLTWNELMNQSYPVPPPELVEQWRYAASNVPASLATDPGGRRDYIDYIATQAARWGADQELRACCDTLQRHAHWDLAVFELMDDRRPKPPTLKEQALEQLDGIATCFRATHMGDIVCDKIRAALEQLPDAL